MRKRKIISIVLSIMMVLTMFNLSAARTAYAEDPTLSSPKEGAIPSQGLNIGLNGGPPTAKWDQASHTLTISGRGKIAYEG